MLHPVLPGSTRVQRTRVPRRPNWARFAGWASTSARASCWGSPSPWP